VSKPTTYRVHFGARYQDFPQRARANGFAIMMRAAGHAGVRVEPKRDQT
jgi:hypothetical protein